MLCAGDWGQSPALVGRRMVGAVHLNRLALIAAEAALLSADQNQNPGDNRENRWDDTET